MHLFQRMHVRFGSLLPTHGIAVHRLFCKQATEVHEQCTLLTSEAETYQQQQWLAIVLHQEYRLQDLYPTTARRVSASGDRPLR